MKVGVLEIEMMANMARLSKDLKRANSEITSAVRGFNNVLNTIGVGISFAFFADLARRSNEFEKSLAKISTQIDDTSGQIDKLANSSKNFASQYGTSQVEQANAFYEIISAGIEDTTKATEILNTANKLAIGGITSLGVSVDGLTNIMNSYAGKVESADAVSDALFIGMKAGKATMEELSSGLGKVTPLAATLNVSFDELVAVLATLSKQGIQTSEAITGVRAILSAVAKPTTQAAKTAEELGLQFNAASLQAKGFAGFIEDVISKTDGSTTALSTLFGRVEALVPVLSLAGTGGEDFNNILEQMGDKAGATQEAFEKMAASPGFKVDQLMSSISNAAISLGAVLSDLLTPAIVAATNAFNGLFLTEEKSPVQKQIELITSLEKQLASELDKKNIPFGETFLFSKRDADLLAQRLDDARADLVLLQKTAEDTGTATGVLKEDIEELAGDTGGTSGVSSLSSKVDKTKQKIDSFVESIKRQAAEAGKTANEIKRMEAAQLGVLNVVEPYLTVIEKQAIAEEDLRKSREKQADDLRKIEQITTSMRTKQEIYNDTVKELNDLLTKGLGVDVYNRALQKAQEELNNTDKTARDAFSNTEQYAIQAARNIQSIFANAITSIFTGFQGLGDSIKNVLVSTLSQVASSNVLRGLGIGVAGGAAANGGGFSDLLSTGFGLTNAVSAIGGGLPGSIGAFFSGFGGGTVAGVSSPAALAGSSFASFAGPAAIAGVADIALRQIFGDKKLGGTAGDILSYVPVVGTLINGLFGRGAPKFQNESLVGNVSAAGFDGVLNQAYREKGGLARSDRVSNFIADTDTGALLNQFGRLSESGNIPGSLRDSVTDPAVKRALEVGKFLDEAFGSIGDTLKQTADKLGLSADALNNFNVELDLVSEKGQTLSEEQISAEITRISDAMIDTLIPNLGELAKKGETSADTLNRLNAQFSVLESAAMLFGNTAEQAAEKVRALGIDGQSAFIESLGGVQVAAAEIQEFYDTVFTDSQKLEVTKNRILDVLKPLGVDFVPTLDQLYEAVKSGNPELIRYAFLIDGLVVDYNRLSDAIGLSSTQIDDSVKTTEDAAKKEAELAKVREASIRVAEKSARAERQKAEAEKFAAELDAINAIRKEAESLRDTFLRSGDAAGAIMNELAIISENIQFTSAGAFNAALAKQIADASQAVANRASENALRVPNVSDFINTALQNITSDSIVTPIYIGIRDAIVDGSGDMSNAVRDSVDGFTKVIAREQARISRAPRGQGIAGVLSAQSDLSFVSAAGFSGGQKQFGRDVLAYGEAIRKLDDRLSDGQITASEYDGAIAGLNDVMGGAAKLFGDVESQFERIRNSGLALASSGINAIGFYFNDITKQVAELNKQAAESGSAISQTTDAIGRLKSASFVFGQSVGAVFSGNAAAGISFAGSPETDKAALIGQAAGIAAQVLTTADAAKFAQQLAGQDAFSSLGDAGLRDISLLLDGLKAFDPASFENAFLRINDALITGAVTQEQYNVLFNTALDEFEGLGTSAGGAKSALGQLREAARNLADELLLGDKSILSVFQKTSEAQRQYNEIIDRARAGNATSSELSSGVNNLLDAQLNSASNKFEFDRQFATVINDLRSIGQTTEDKRLEEQKKSAAELKDEIKQLRQELNAANVAIAKSTAKTADVLDRWSVVGLPATEA